MDTITDNSEDLRSLYRAQDDLKARLAEVEAKIKAEAGVWQRSRRMFGLGPEGVRRMILQPY
jgi:hypothetical protein